MRNLFAVSPRVPGSSSSSQGESVPKPRRKRVGDGKQVNIPAPRWMVSTGGTEKGSRAELLDYSVQARRQTDQEASCHKRFVDNAER